MVISKSLSVCALYGTPVTSQSDQLFKSVMLLNPLFFAFKYIACSLVRLKPNDLKL